jgi:hypothetical protein
MRAGSGSDQFPQRRAPLEAEFAAVSYNAQNDRPESADVMATMLQDADRILQTYQVHPLPGIIVGELHQSEAESIE